jgi:hypothetical protein
VVGLRERCSDKSSNHLAVEVTGQSRLVIEVSGRASMAMRPQNATARAGGQLTKLRDGRKGSQCNFYYGFLGNCHRARKLAQCRKLLAMAPAAAAGRSADYRDRYETLTGMSLRQCPHCLTGIMVVIGCIERSRLCLPAPDI